MPDPADQLDAIATLATLLHQSAITSRQRRALLLSGSKEWCLTAADHIATQFSRPQSLWVSSQLAAERGALTNREVFKHLGGEMELVIYDAHSGFDADAFGAVTGVIRGSGLLLLLTPPLDTWPQQHDPEAERFFCDSSGPSPFIQRFIKIARQADGVAIVEEGGDAPAPPPSSTPTPAPSLAGDLYRSKEQMKAVEAIVNMAQEQRHRPTVLISDRGRGKSSALGIAAAQLMQYGLERIIVTGPRLDSVEPVFQHAHRLMPNSHRSRGLVETGEGRLEYMAPDELIINRPQADLLLVDEAAAIPTPMLSELLSHHTRIAFATTVHGYEGTGRGFALKFNKVLDSKTPGWQQLQLQQPVRWADDDPLERFVFDALLLNAAIADATELEKVDLKDCRIEQIQRERLIQDDALLSQLFGLLVLAHYRTRPNDLRQLLDSPGLQIHVARHGAQIVAVALLIDEGGLNDDLAQQVYRGERRLHGHLLPQSLSFHAGISEATQLHYLRLMRIAVHPAVQGQGIGSKLLGEIAANIDEQKYDCIGTSFGVTAELFKFWQRLGFVPARLGLTREHSSGTHSLIMLRGISTQGRQLAVQAHKRMQYQLPAMLSDPLRDFDPMLAGLLLQGRETADTTIWQHDWQDIFSFAHTNRGYEFCMAAIGKLVERAVADKAFISGLSAQQRQLLITKVIQKQSWAQAVSTCDVSGRSAAIKLLRTTLQQLASHYCPATTRQQIKQSLDL